MENYEIIYEYKTEDNSIIVKDRFEDGEINFYPEEALAVLLLEKKVFLNNNWWRQDFSKEQKELFSINVDCSDVFMWGASDAEELLFEELEDLFEHYAKDPVWGTAVWCIKKRRYLPQKPVYEKIQKNGIWDLSKIDFKK